MNYTANKREPLTPREHEVNHHVVQGLTNEGIAIKLGVSPRTVEAHISSSLAKAGITSGHKRVKLALWWLTEGRGSFGSVA